MANTYISLDTLAARTRGATATLKKAGVKKPLASVIIAEAREPSREYTTGKKQASHPAHYGAMYRLIHKAEHLHAEDAERARKIREASAAYIASLKKVK